MKLLSRWALFSAGILLLVFAVSAAAGAPPANKTRHTKGWIQTVAMNGPQVAYSTGSGLAYGPGDKVYLWNVQTGAGRLISAHNPDPVYELAISRTRVAWIARGGTAPDPTAEINETLFSAPLRKPSRPEVLDSAHRTESYPVPLFPGGCAGDWIGGLVGSSSLLAVNRWETTGASSEVTRAELDLITPGGLRQRVAGAGSIIAQWTDGRRFAVLQSREAWPAAGRLCGTTPSPTVAVYAPTGKLLAQLTVPGAKEVALSGNGLATLTKTSRIEVYDWRTGRLAHSWRVPHASYVHLEDVYGQIAVYSAYSHGRNLHLLQLATGKDVLLTKGLGLGPSTSGDDAQLEAPGLVYAVDKPGEKEVGKLVFVPMARVLAAVSKGRAPSRAQLVASPGRAAASKKNGDILYVDARDRAGRRLYLIRPDGTHRRTIAGARNAWFPAWSPDGKWIVYGRTRTIGGLCVQLYVIRADGTHGWRLTHDGSCYRDPAWSPGGQRIAFAKEGALGKDSIWTMKLDGSGLRQLTDDGDNPAWSPDGRTIAFERGVLARAIWLMDANGANQRQLTMPVERLGGHSDQDFQPDWSPNGTQIAFSRLHPANRTFVSDIYVIRRDGSGLRVLTRPHARGTMPAWSPDGRRIVFLGGDPAHESATGLYVMKADGSGRTRLTKSDNEWPDWGPRR